MDIPASLINQDRPYALFWFRRDLRLHDNAGFYHALKGNDNVLPIFIFDTEILDELTNSDDKRVCFIFSAVLELKEKLESMGSSLLSLYGKPDELFEELKEKINIKAVYTNHDYEPYAINRDKLVEETLRNAGITFHTYKDQVIFERHEVIKDDGHPYKVFTPYSKKWKSLLNPLQHTAYYKVDDYMGNLVQTQSLSVPLLEEMGFDNIEPGAPPAEFNTNIIKKYDQQRDFPASDGTSRLGVHIRFGTVSIRQAVQKALELNETWLNELIWREFYMQILYHYPFVTGMEFNPKYRHIPWRYDEDDFSRWCIGQTGYPIVDAGMRELNETGYMHNRIRMITASFLTKHLLIDWRWGERYFAEKLLDYELASNNGNWQWVAGTGVDAAPYFRVFNPETQTKKFDPKRAYIQKWVPELHSFEYPDPMVEHKEARERYLKTMKSAFKTD
ncbi:MAG: DNA photolyase family protein [Bacteroidales bacterium]|nr:DNA photolyase family protein [Bacteroidales bacterium]